MINRNLLNLLAVVTIFSANFYSFISSIATHSTTNIDFLANDPLAFKSNQNTGKAKAVTTSERSRKSLNGEEKEQTEMIEPLTTEPELTPSEKKLETLKEWKTNFPNYDSDTHQIQFIEAIAPAAVFIANAHGIYPSVMIAQAALESSWGQSGLAQSYNNLMGTKGSWKGQSVTVSTREDVNGQSIYIQAGFSVYDSWAESLSRYGQLMENGVKHDSEIYQGTWRKNAKTYQEATAWLQGRYATDTAYANKLNQTIESFHLDQYDEIQSPAFDLDESLPLLAINI